MSLLTKIIFVTTATTTGLIAGLLYAYSCSVNLGLGRLSDAAYLTAMQSINKAILNPFFFFSFLGTALLLPICTYFQYNKLLTDCFWYLLGATLVYLIGVLGVTMFGNVPLNDKLEAFSIETASIENLKSMRSEFETSWNNFHFIRTLAAIVSFVLVILACLTAKAND